MNSSELDMVFLHGQGYEEGNPQRHDDIPRPSIAGRLEIAAADWLTTQHGIAPEKFVVSGDIFTGRHNSLARVDAEALKRKTDLSEDDVIVDETALTTYDEVQKAAEIAREHEWKKVVHITVDPLHKQEVKMLTQRAYDKDVHVDVVTAEEIFKRPLPENSQSEQTQKNQTKYLDYFKKYNWSRPALMLRAYEIPKVIITALHGEKLMKKIATKYRPDPTQSPLEGIKKFFGQS